MSKTNLVIINRNVKNSQDDALIASFKNEASNLVLFEASFNNISELSNDFPIETVNLVDITNLLLVYNYPGYDVIPFYNDVDVSFNNGYFYMRDDIVDLIEILPNRVNVKLVTSNEHTQDFIDEMASISIDLNVNIIYSNTNNINPGGNGSSLSLGSTPLDGFLGTGITAWTGSLNGSIVLKDLSFNNNDDISKSVVDGKTIYTLKKDVSASNIIIENTPIALGDENFFRIGKDEIFDGNNHTIDFSGIIVNGAFSLDSTGLSTNDTSNYPIIRNLGAINGSSLASSSGYLVRQYQPFFEILNCYNTGSIGGSGGLVGTHAGRNGGRCIISNSYNTGDMLSSYCGGICGIESGWCEITNCYNTGSISGGGGGMVGANAGNGGGNCIIKNCYNSGNINNGGGIAGYAAGGNGSANCKIIDCYNTGNISFGGGIVNTLAGNNGGHCKIINCYNTGNITNNSGGITGSNLADQSGNCDIVNCYNTGTIDNTSYGILMSGAGRNDGTCNLKNSYSDGELYDTNDTITLLDNGTIDQLENITSQSKLSTLFIDTIDASMGYIPDIYNNSNSQITYPLLRGIFENYIEYNNYDVSIIVTKSELINNKDKQTITELKRFFNSNIEGNKTISIWLDKYYTPDMKIFEGKTGEVLEVDPNEYKTYMRFSKDKTRITGFGIVPTDGKITFASGIIPGNLSDSELKELGFTIGEFVTAGRSLRTIKELGYSFSDWLRAGYSYFTIAQLGVTSNFTRNNQNGPTTNTGSYYAMNRKLTRDLTLGAGVNQAEIKKSGYHFDSSIRTRQVVLFNNVYNK